MPPDDTRENFRTPSSATEIPDSPFMKKENPPRMPLSPTALGVLEKYHKALNNPKNNKVILDEEDVNTLRKEYGFPKTVSNEKMLQILSTELRRWEKAVATALQNEEDNAIIKQNLGASGYERALRETAGGGGSLYVTPKAREILGIETQGNGMQSPKSGDQDTETKSPPARTADEVANVDELSAPQAGGVLNGTDHLNSLVLDARQNGANFDQKLMEISARVAQIQKSQAEQNAQQENSDGGVAAFRKAREDFESVREVIVGSLGNNEDIHSPPVQSNTQPESPESLQRLPDPHTPEEIDAAIARVMGEARNAPSVPPQVFAAPSSEGPVKSRPNPDERPPAVTKFVTDSIPVLEQRARYYGPQGVAIPREGTPVDLGDGKNWKVQEIGDENIVLGTEDGTEQRDVPLAEFAAARRRAEEEERRMEEETRAQLERMEESKRFSLGATLERIRYDVARGVAESASSALGGISKAFTGKPTGRFFAALSSAYEARAEEETKKLAELEKTRLEGTRAGAAYQNIANAGSIVANVLKYGRILADAAGATATAPLRWVTLGAMAAQEAADVTKEARFTYDEVKEKTRIQDIERAHEEALALTERALRNKGLTLDDLKEGKSVSAEELQEAYREGLPKDLLERLKRDPMPGTGRGIVERMYRTYIAWRAEGLQKKIDAIDAAPGDPREKAAKKRELLLRFGRSKALNDFDRMLGEQGTIDRIAMGADISSIVSKSVIYGTMAQSVYLLFDRIAEALSEKGVEVVPTGPASDLVDKSSVETAIASPETPETSDSSFAADARDAWNIAEHGGAAIERVPLPEYTVQAGDSTYKILREHVPAFRDLGRGRAQEYAMAKFLSLLSPEEVRAAGFSSGNTQMIYPGERINLEFLEQLARRGQGESGESVIEQALRRYGASEPLIVTAQKPEDISPTVSEIREVVEPIVQSQEMERLAREAVREETLFRYIDRIILTDDFHGDRDHWNALAAFGAQSFLETPQTTAEGVLLQKRLYSLAQISKTPPLPFESVHEFVDRAFRNFIELSGVEPKANEPIEEYLERATESYLRVH